MIIRVGAKLAQSVCEAIMPTAQKKLLIAAINKKDKLLVDSVVAYFDLNPQELLVLSEKANGSSAHIDFLRLMQSEYSSQSTLLKETDLLSAKHGVIASEWECLIKAAIACLRRKDKREPYINDTSGSRQPTAYGVETLRDFYKKFIDFEDILYGADRWYRDHVIHAYRVWLLGLSLLITTDSLGATLASKIADEMGVDGFPERRGRTGGTEAENFLYSEGEIFSIWTVAALTHDLGYPLQKAPSILRTIQDMMGYFVVAPDLRHDFKFNTAADNVNDYIVRLISTKMVRRRAYRAGNEKKQIYSGRVQPKFYVKFLKSLESSQHGIISSIVLYKALVFFLESDCNLCEDYYFDGEEARQFYIRREILRAMATHTCDDIYQMYVTNFSFLLYLSDELQEWGRNKFFSIKDERVYMYPPECKLSNFTEINVTQKFVILSPSVPGNVNDSISAFKQVTNKIIKDFFKYKKVFREGIDTDKRSFSYTKTATIVFDGLNGFSVKILCRIPKTSKAVINYKEVKGTPQERAAVDEVMKENNIILAN
jgi:hypothetical protein